MADQPNGVTGLRPTLGAHALLELGRAAQPAPPAVAGLTGWLRALLDRNGPLAASLVPAIDIAAERARCATALAAGDHGTPLSEPDLLQRAARHAVARGRAEMSEFDIAAVLLEMAGMPVLAPREIGRLPRPAESAATTTGDRPPAPSAPSPATAPGAGEPTAATWKPHATGATPTLDRFGRDLTGEAAAGKLVPVVGREDAVTRIIETLCRRQKRNPILLGEAGTGKTAIVEGLAQRIVRGETPAALRGARIVQLQPSSLVAGGGIVGEIESRMRAILEEARQDGIVLFIDEVHAIVGTGGMRGTGDLASLLKPALARGELACIAATTDDEYRRFIADDAALERRFNPIVVDELDATATLAVLQAHRDDLRRLRGIDVPNDVLDWLVDFAAQAMPNRHFPDKAVDLLEQCVASAVVAGRSDVNRAAAEDVARRMVGVPLSIGDRIAAVERSLVERGLADSAAAAGLAARLRVTMRGLDRRRHRANAVVAVTPPASDRVHELAERIADGLYGASERVVTLELGRMTAPHDVAMLVGAPPGYVGYSDRLPIHRIAAAPWSVVLCEGTEAAHPEVRELIAEALEAGLFVDGAGRRIPLGDTIVLLALDAAAVARPVGFRPADTTRDVGVATLNREDAPIDRARLGRTIGDRLASLVDLVISAAGAADAVATARRVLDEVARRFGQAGVALEFTPALVAWLVERAGEAADLEATADRDLVPVLASLVGSPEAGGRLIVELDSAGRPVARPARPAEAAATGAGGPAAS